MELLQNEVFCSGNVIKFHDKERFDRLKKK
jgi:hypothetical protein